MCKFKKSRRWSRIRTFLDNEVCKQSRGFKVSPEPWNGLKGFLPFEFQKKKQNRNKTDLSDAGDYAHMLLSSPELNTTHFKSVAVVLTPFSSNVSPSLVWASFGFSPERHSWCAKSIYRMPGIARGVIPLSWKEKKQLLILQDWITLKSLLQNFIRQEDLDLLSSYVTCYQ